MNVTPQAVKAALKGKLKPGKTTEYQAVRDATMKAGVNLRSRVSMKAYKAMAAFEELKKEKLLTAAAARSGKRTFLQQVHKKEETLAKKPPSHAKTALRERLKEEEKQKQKITEALQTKSSEHETVSKETIRRTAPPPIVAPPPIIQKNPVARPMPEKSESELDLPL